MLQNVLSLLQIPMNTSLGTRETDHIGNCLFWQTNILKKKTYLIFKSQKGNAANPKFDQILNRIMTSFFELDNNLIIRRAEDPFLNVM